MAAMHLIRFPNKAQHKRAIMALLEVPRIESLGLPDFQMVVTDEHIQALEGARVAFAYLSKTGPNGKAATSLQS
jgi:hypothetical protein